MFDLLVGQPRAMVKQSFSLTVNELFCINDIITLHLRYEGGNRDVILVSYDLSMYSNDVASGEDCFEVNGPPLLVDLPAVHNQNGIIAEYSVSETILQRSEYEMMTKWA